MIGLPTFQKFKIQKFINVDFTLQKIKNLNTKLNILQYYIITLRIQAVESHDLLEDKRTELRHTKLFVRCSQS
jgi:hypothetical protein